jgi:glucosamine--fructose-6-phosphate aminotransferase (isomerizing)
MDGETPMSLMDELFEQPTTIARLIEEQDDEVKRIAATIRGRGIRWVYLAARGSSDYAGLYAKYLWGAFNRLPMALAAPSLFSVYRTPPDIADALVIGISQSGQSPDIVSVMTEGRRQGALTLAITNDPTSPLAEESELVIDLMAGPEVSVAATKTYTAQLVAVAMLSAALAEDADRRAWLRRLPAIATEVLALDETVERAAERYRFMEQCVVLGRGYNYATAFEWAIKLKELAYVFADPYSPADFQHGPVALAHQGFPVLAVAPRGKVSDNLTELLIHLVDELKVELLAVSNDPAALELAHTPIRLPDDVPEWLSPVPAIIPAQLFCYHITRAKGYDTEQPRGLTKVTLTW